MENARLGTSPKGVKRARMNSKLGPRSPKSPERVSQIGGSEDQEMGQSDDDMSEADKSENDGADAIFNAAAAEALENDDDDVSIDFNDISTHIDKQIVSSDICIKWFNNGCIDVETEG